MIFFDPFDASMPIETQNWIAIDRYLGLPDDKRLWSIAEQIDKMHANQRDPTQSWRNPKHRFVGLYGERAFARIFKLRMDLRFLKYGNARNNFKLSDGTVVDVVTRSWTNPLNSAIQPELTLRHKGNPSSKKTLCLVYYCGQFYEPVIVGYITEKEAHRVGRVDQFADGIVNVVVPTGMLNDPSELLRAHDPESPWLRAHEENKRRAKEAVENFRAYVARSEYEQTELM